MQRFAIFFKPLLFRSGFFNWKAFALRFEQFNLFVVSAIRTNLTGPRCLVIGMLAIVVATGCEEKLRSEAESDAIAKISNDKGFEEAEQRNWASARRLYREALDVAGISNDSKRIFYRNLALTYDNEEEKDSMLKILQMAKEGEVEGSYGYLAFSGDIFIVEGKIDSALIIVEPAYGIDSNEIVANNLLGLVYMGDYGQRWQNPEKALKFTRRAFEIEVDASGEDNLATACYQNGKYTESEMHWHRLHKKFPQIQRYAFDLATAKYRLGKRKEADALFKSLATADDAWEEKIDEFLAENRYE